MHHLDQLEAEAIHVIREVAAELEKPVLLFSGGKGYHVGVPLPHNPDPSPAFHRVARRLAEGLAAGAGVAELIGFAALYRALAVGAMSVVAPVSVVPSLLPEDRTSCRVE